MFVSQYCSGYVRRGKSGGDGGRRDDVTCSRKMPCGKVITDGVDGRDIAYISDGEICGVLMNG